jgi:hypothetical protein
MLIAAAVCPHPPLLVPEVAGAAAAELDDLRAACDEAIAHLTAAGAELVAVVGAATRTGDYGLDPVGTLRPYGLDLTVGPRAPGVGGFPADRRDGSAPAALPLSLTIGRWLLTRGPSGGRPRRRTAWYGVASEEPPAGCVQLGRDIAALAPSVALLCMGDGSVNFDVTGALAGRTGRTDAFDRTVASALANADQHTLGGLDPGLATRLSVAGRPAWQVLAGAAGHARFIGELLADQAPYGVRYYVARWWPAGS